MSAKRQLRSFTSDDRFEAAMSLLAALTSSPTGTVDAAAFAQDYALTIEQVDAVVGGLQLLADDFSGARAIVYRAGNDIVLEGSAGRLDPLRLTPDAAEALTSVIERFQLDESVKQHVLQALAPSTSDPAPQKSRALASDALFGRFFQAITEAISYGMRLKIAYRSGEEAAARIRLVDPGSIEVAGDAAYLIAWDVEKDAQRRYRLDRIVNVEVTDDSVERHAFRRQTTAESLQATGKTAYVRFASRSLFDQCSWAGLNRAEARECADGAVVAPVSYVSEPWLFDQIIAEAGDIIIEGPSDLREKLLGYARWLARQSSR